ncbi:MAG: D-ribose pyranase [Anaerolineales bacterium]|nr:D-ribose pyranase [Anaerolineales bacterium]
MKKSNILNKELCTAIAAMGHTDMMIVCDAGFPIPNDAWRVDLAVVQDVPDLETVLSAIADEMIVEKVSYAAEMAKNNPPLLEKVERIFPASNMEPVPHAQILSEMAQKAKVIVRTGAFDPWGNILLYSGVDAPVWFSKPGLNVPEEYAERVRQMKEGNE